MNMPNNAEPWNVVADRCADLALRTLVSVDASRSTSDAALHIMRSNISLFPNQFNAATCLAIGRKLNTIA